MDLNDAPGTIPPKTPTEDKQQHDCNETPSANVPLLPSSPNSPAHTSGIADNGSTLDGTIPSQAHRRQAYHRLTSSADVTPEGDGHRSETDRLVDTNNDDGNAIGLGIVRKMSRMRSPKKVSIDSTPRNSPLTKSPSSGDKTPKSPIHFRSLSGLSSPDVQAVQNEDTAYGGAGAQEPPLEFRGHRSNQPSTSSLQSSLRKSFRVTEEEFHGRPSTPGAQSAFDVSFHPPHACPPSHPFYQKGWSWFAIALITYTVFSTVFSGIFLIIAWKGTRWGSKIRTGSIFKPSDASIVTTVLAKAIELSFVAAVVTFLGQALSRRAFNKDQGRGVTLAEFSMRSWILQPGTMMTHPSSVKYGALSVLGAFSLAATILATLYTTAANALVLPQLKYGNWEPKSMQGLVRASFGNVQYIKSNCATPVSDTIEEHSSADCFQVQNAGQSFLNYKRYLAIWSTMNDNSNGTIDPYSRPPGFGLMYENTTITAPWIDIQPPLNENGRIITNSSLAYPHAGVFQAARDPVNNILQPQELDGLGLYGVRAAVASPVINVLCVQTPNRSDLDPIVYTSWNNGTNLDLFNGTIWPEQIKDLHKTSFTNTTVLDSYFHWGDPNDGLRARPIFGRYPIPHDTLLNHTQYGYGRDAIYLLGQGLGDPGQLEYVICELSASLTPDCSTDYNATASSGSMEAVCSNTTSVDPMRGRNMDNDHDAIQGNMTRSKDWFDVGSQWAGSLALHTGITQGKGSNSRLLMNLLLKRSTWGGPQRLNRFLPSVSEALAVMAGASLMYSSLDAPFNTRQWPETFKAWVRGQEYASGGIDAKSRAFLLILFFVFLFNALMLGYFLSQRGLVTDYSEPPNLFALALNSPPSHLLAGSCGAGPHGDQYKVNWFFQQENDHLYMESGAEPEGYTHGGTKMPYVDGEEIELVGSPHQAQFNTLSKRKSLL